MRAEITKLQKINKFFVDKTYFSVVDFIGYHISKIAEISAAK